MGPSGIVYRFSRMPVGTSRTMLAKRFCKCIKRVRKTVRARGVSKQTSQAKESAAIAICTRSVLGSRGRTLRKFKCGTRPKLETQAPLK